MIKKLNWVPSPKLFGHTKELLELLGFQKFRKRKNEEGKCRCVALVKELVYNNLIQTNWLSIDRRKVDGYELRFKGNCELPDLDIFLQKRYLAMEKNKEKGFVIIFKP